MTPTPDLEFLSKRCERSITTLSDAQALAHIAHLIDDSSDLSFDRGLARALRLLDDLSRRELMDTDAALVEYYRANAWAAKSKVAKLRQSWSWESKERQDELLALSRAANHPGFVKLDKVRRCQILTNYANLLNTVGRCIDAIAVWDAALSILPTFAMARGNRGLGLKLYASMVCDNRERTILALHGLKGVRAAMAEDALFDSADPRLPLAYFASQEKDLASVLDVDPVPAMQYLGQGDEGRSKIERLYRRWCLEHRLFLCPLNDLGPHLAAATDNLMLPPLRESLNARTKGHLPPQIVSYFSQMKQEYVSARFMLFEGMSSARVHFSDRRVLLTETFDYPLYSLASERIRTAFRIGYSLLDKVAFLVHRYWALGKVEKFLNFKNVWVENENRGRLLPQLEKRENLPLRGLFWLSKELFDDQLKQTTANDARELHSIRNALEHNYLRVSEGWAKPFTISEASSDCFGMAIGSDELEAKTIRVMKIARSALFYVSFAIDIEERKKRGISQGGLVAEMPLYTMSDRRRRRDPV